MHCLSSVYLVSQPLHASGIFVAHHQAVYSSYTATGTCIAEEGRVNLLKHIYISLQCVKYILLLFTFVKSLFTWVQ